MIGCPCRDRGWILPKYLEYIRSLDYPKDRIILCFIYNDSTDDTLNHLVRFQEKHQAEYKDIIIVVENHNQVKDERVHSIRLKIYDSLAKLRNSLLDFAVKMNVDYLFSVDSDILVPKNALQDLIDSNKPIVSAQIWNDLAGRYPNVLIKKGDRIVHYLDFPKNSTFRCHTTGAVYLLDKDSFSRCRYKFDKQGEDIGFCTNAEKLGIQVWCNSSVYCNHIMNQEKLKSLEG